MRRSAIRAALRTIIEGEAPTAAYGGVQAFTHTKALDLVAPSQTTAHGLYVVELGRAVPIDRGGPGDAMRSPCVVQFAFRVRDGVDELGKWADVDACNDTVENVVTALLTQGSGWTASLVGFDVATVEQRTDVVVGVIDLVIHHDLAGA